MAGLGDSRRAISVTLHRPPLLRAQLSFGAMWAGEWAVMVGLGVVAFRDGGAAAVGLVAVLRMVPPRCSRRSPPRSRMRSGASTCWRGSASSAR
jgi:hypothetical protein